MKANLKVKLLEYTKNPEQLIAASAKLCYSPLNSEEIIENLEEKDIEKSLNLLAELGHESPIEHVSFTFSVEGVSRSLLAQLTRHRIASYSVKSQRYVDENRFYYIIPPEIENIKEARECFLKSMEELQKSYETLTNILKEKHKKEFEKDGCSPQKAISKAAKKAIEDARYVLPNSCETKIIMTMNARSLMNFFHLRCCERAQWEIQNLANEILKLVKNVAPVLFKNAGPRCLLGACPEGKMTCGKMKEQIAKYKNLGD